MGTGQVRLFRARTSTGSARCRRLPEVELAHELELVRGLRELVGLVARPNAVPYGRCKKIPQETRAKEHFSTGGSNTKMRFKEVFSSSSPRIFSSTSPHGLAMGVDAESLELSWNNPKPTPCLLVRPTYQATSHHAAAAACVLNARAPLGVTHHTNERARKTSTTAPPCPRPTQPTRGTGRAIADKPGFVSRVVVVVMSPAVVGRVFGSSTEELNGGRHRGGK